MRSMNLHFLPEITLAQTEKSLKCWSEKTLFHVGCRINSIYWLDTHREAHIREKSSWHWQSRWYSETLIDPLNYDGDDSRWFFTTFASLTGLSATLLLRSSPPSLIFVVWVHLYVCGVSARVFIPPCANKSPCIAKVRSSPCVHPAYRGMSITALNSNSPAVRKRVRKLQFHHLDQYHCN